jgi:hypothetical protein
MGRSDESSLNIPITLLRGENNSGTDSLAGMSCIIQWELKHAPPGVLHTYAPKGRGLNSVHMYSPKRWVDLMRVL